MLKHRKITSLFVVLLITLFIADLRLPIQWWHYGIVILLYSLVEFYGAYYIRSNFHVRAICAGDPSEKTISLTFDDGPSQYTEKVLDVLNQEKVPACFFVIGSKIKDSENIVKRIVSEGHLLGNHSYSHNFWYDFKNKREFISDLSIAAKAIYRASGKYPMFFRPPYGVTTPALAKAAKYLGYQVIGWNIRSLDTKISDKQQLLTRIKKRIRPGSILLLHDTVAGTELVLKELIDFLRQNNYRIVGLDQLLNKRAYA